MNKSVTHLRNCRICHSQKLFKFLNLGLMPIPNGFLKKEDLNIEEKKFELSCVFCENCGLVQLSNIVNPDLMFKNYVYVPSGSKMMMENFRDLFIQIHKALKLDQNSFVVDIGSNDGSLLSFFKDLGVKILGVDPAENLAKVAQLKGIPTEVMLFNLKNAAKIRKKYGPADVITATNVVAHINDLHDFFKGISHLLSTDGILITEFPYLAELVRGNEFDTIYHEHLSYFSLKPWQRLIKTYGFEIVKAQKLTIHGGSIRLIHSKKGSKIKKDKKSLNYFVALDKKYYIYNKRTFTNFTQKIELLKIDLLNLLRQLKHKGKKIVGYGAAAKGNILTNYFDIGIETLDYIVDSTPYKQGLFTPGKHIPVHGESRLIIDKPDYALLLAWNFAEEIIEKEKTFRKLGGKFIIPSPKLKIV